MDFLEGLMAAGFQPVAATDDLLVMQGTPVPKANPIRTDHPEDRPPMNLFAPAEDWKSSVDLKDYLDNPLGLLKHLRDRGVIELTVDDKLGKVYAAAKRVVAGIPGSKAEKVKALLAHASQMIGLEEVADRKEIEVITSRSGINPSTTPWCAAWAMNLLELHGLVNLKALANRNYCPTIVDWAKDQRRWLGRGGLPQPGEAILFCWHGDGVADHIGLVERVADNVVHTIEGNSNDMVRRRAYGYRSEVILGYVSIG